MTHPVLEFPKEDTVDILVRAKEWAARNCPVPISWEETGLNRWNTPRYDGKRYFLYHCRNDPARIVHEVNHYFVAAQRRRLLPDFGLGNDPDGAIAERALKSYNCDREEFAVTLLDVQVLEELGYPDEERADWMWEVVKGPKGNWMSQDQSGNGLRHDFALGVRYLAKRKITLRPETVAWVHKQAQLRDERNEQDRLRAEQRMQEAKA